MRFFVLLGVLLVWVLPASAQGKPRARDLGIPFPGEPGSGNAITDVPGVEIGHTTLIRGEGPLRVGHGPVRTGVTVVLPRGQQGLADPVFAGYFSLNGNGEMTGMHWVEEGGFLETPLAITNTHSVGTVRDAMIAWQHRKGAFFQSFLMPAVAETFDGWLNDVNGFHVKPEHVTAALESAGGGRVAEGNVGGGTGMMCYGFKGGIGTASRRTADHTVGVLVQANFGRRDQLLIAGVPVGQELACSSALPCRADAGGRHGWDGSIIIVVATDAPLAPHQLKRLARRATLGLARTGATSSNGSGDLFLAFSTANPGAAKASPAAVTLLANNALNPVFDAVVYATEEAIINALVAAETMTGVDGHRAVALPHGEVEALLRRYGRLAK